MKEQIFFKGKYFEIKQIIFDGSELVEFLVKKIEDDDDEICDGDVDLFLKILNQYFLHLDNVKRKYIMIVNIENKGLLSIGRFKKIINVLKVNRPHIENYCLFSSVIVRNSMIRGMLNIGLKFYTNVKPLFFEADYEICRQTILDNINSQNTM